MIDGEEFEPFEMDDNIDNLKKMQIPDANFLKKINEADNQFMRKSVEKHGGNGGLRTSSIKPLPGFYTGATITPIE